MLKLFERDIIDSSLKPKIFSKTQSPPLLILNGFQFKDKNEERSKNYSIVSIMMQSLFPLLNVTQVLFNIFKKLYLMIKINKKGSN